MKVVVAAGAEQDLNEAAGFYDDREPGLGREVVAFLLGEIKELSATAGSHRRVGRFHRKIVQGRFPYFSIYYKAAAAEVEVIAVLDGRRDPAYNRERLRSR